MQASFEAPVAGAGPSPARGARASSVPASERLPDRCGTPSGSAAAAVANAGLGGQGRATTAPRPGSVGARSAPAGVAGPLVNTQDRFSPRCHREGLKRSYRLRSCAGRLLPNESVARCGKRTWLGYVAIKLKDGRARYAGVRTCGNIWTCPVCARKIALERAAEVRALADSEVRDGAEIYMAAFTIPHHRFQTAKELRWAVSRAWSKLIGGAPWKRAAAKVGLRGTVRALEVTHGENGWRPHIHAIFSLKPARANGAADVDGGPAERVALFGL